MAEGPGSICPCRLGRPVGPARPAAVCIQPALAPMVPPGHRQTARGPRLLARLSMLQGMPGETGPVLPPSLRTHSRCAPGGKCRWIPRFLRKRLKGLHPHAPPPSLALSKAGQLPFGSMHRSPYRSPPLQQESICRRLGMYAGAGEAADIPQKGEVRQNSGLQMGRACILCFSWLQPQHGTSIRHVPLNSQGDFVFFHKGGRGLTKTIEQKSEDIL